MGRLQSLDGNTVSLIGMDSKINIDDVIDKCNKTQNRMGNNNLLTLGRYDKNTGRKVKSSKGKDTLTYDELVEFNERKDEMKSHRSFSLFNSEQYDDNDEYDDEYVCDVCPHKCTSYDNSLCDACNECEECSEYIDNECSGCSYSIHRDNSYYWERHPDILPKSETDDAILRYINSSDNADIDLEDFSIK